MNLYATQLECLLAILAIGTLLTDAFRPAADKRKLGYVLAALVAGALAASYLMPTLPEPLFHGMYRLDSFALFFKRLFLLATALALATEIAKGAPLAVAGTRRALELLQPPIEAGALTEIAADLQRAWMSEDAAEARVAFREKRKPQFKGR